MLTRSRLYAGVKYLTYSLLIVNVYLFLAEELNALQHTFMDGFGAGELVQIFSTTIDTAAWVFLLLLFELETSVLEDRRIRGWVRHGLHGARILCYVAIVYAFTGYCSVMMALYDVSPLAGALACERLDETWSVLVTLDHYTPLNAANCASLGGAALKIGGFSVLASPEVLQSARWLAWTDVINAGAWILVVVILEVEVRLQLRRDLSDRIMRTTQAFKSGIYAILFMAAAYWGVKGSFLDFWDASLWLFAFIFIELNVFDWQQETRRETHMHRSDAVAR